MRSVKEIKVGAKGHEPKMLHASDRAELARKHKLPSPEVKAPRRRQSNKWLEVDRSEKIKAVLTVAAVLTVLGVGLWFVARGMRH